LKDLAETALVAGGAARWVGRARSQPIILAYHNIVPEGEEPAGDRSLHLPQRRFGAQLDLLAKSHHIVSLPEILADRARRGGRPPAAITFDDAYRGTLFAGLPEVRKRNLPCTIFVAPGRLGGKSFWWDALADPIDGSVPAEWRHRALTEFKGRDEGIRAWAAGAGIELRELPSHAWSASEDELHTAVRHGGVSLGSHTWSHANMAVLSQAEMMDELVRSLDWLRERFDAVLPWLAYPYGLSSAVAEQAAERAGYEGAVLVGGSWKAKPDACALPRMNIPSGLSARGFALRISGLIPATT
jgi:peptidoglycan/xylan/chitin deacetylase (PgdA/CDA1 family)